MTSHTPDAAPPVLAGSATIVTTVTLEPPEQQWVMDYARHLARLLSVRWTIDFDPESLGAWLEDDLFASRFYQNHRALGMTLRAAADGRPLSSLDVRHGPQILLKHWQSLLQEDPAGIYVAACGEGLLERLATTAIETSSPQLSLTLFVDAVNEAGQHYGVQAHLTDAGVFLPVHVLLRQAPYRSYGDQVYCDAIPLVVPAARRQWRRLLPRLLTTSLAAEALVAVAMDHGDEVLRAVLEVEPATLCAAMPAITRLLHARASYRDGAAWLRLFRMCAAWWAHAPSDAATPPAGLCPPATERAQGASQLLVLAQASVHHHALLPDQLAPLDIEADLPDALRAWLTVFGVERPTETQLQAVLCFVAPARFPKLIKLFTALDWAYRPAPGLSLQDWFIWWRTCAVPLWQRAEDGDRYIAGTAPGASVFPGCRQHDRGLQIVHARPAPIPTRLLVTTCHVPCHRGHHARHPRRPFAAPADPPPPPRRRLPH